MSYYGQKKTVFAFLPIKRWIHRSGESIYSEGTYWLRNVVVMRTIWNGWTAWADDNDAPNLNSPTDDVG